MTNKRNMSTYAKKKDENQADASNHLNTSSEADASMINSDYRSMVVFQIKPQKIVNNSLKVKQLKVYQQITDDYSETQKRF